MAVWTTASNCMEVKVLKMNIKHPPKLNFWDRYCSNHLCFNLEEIVAGHPKLTKFQEEKDLRLKLIQKMLLWTVVLLDLENLSVLKGNLHNNQFNLPVNQLIHQVR